MQQRGPQLLIIGAGPTGLFLAYVLTRQGISVRLIDRRDGPAPESRAMGVQARTLEFYQAFGLADEAVALGIPIETGHVVVHGREAARLSLGHMGRGLSPYPFLLALAQDVHESFLLAKLDELGVAPEWRKDLLTLSQDAEAVHAQIRNADGAVETASFPYLVGCDGAHSATRAALKLGFAGGQSEGLAFVADVAIDRANADFNLALGDDRLGLMIPVRTSGMQRLIGIAPPDLLGRTDLRFEEVGPQLAQMFDVTVRRVNWFSVYHVHHRVAERFHVGRCFLAGDAGHIHSPVGGQGMNTGLGDAMNLSWKLAAVLDGADPALLDSYDTERRAFAKTLIATTDAAFQALTAPGWLARQIRLRVAPRIVALLSKFEATGRLLFRAISQTRIAYRQSPLSEGAAGGVRGGDRLPWLPDADNYAALDGVHWRLQIYGHARRELCAAAEALSIQTSIFEADAAATAAGFAPEAAYLIRPDGYVGLALPDQSAVRFEDYVARHLRRGAIAAKT
jgi:2-polyprenyl-6-methoxyphenol hydroxylase-like FAD-dependent oxidoreductase